jgi:hypothetical protein
MAEVRFFVLMLVAELKVLIIPMGWLGLRLIGSEIVGEIPTMSIH